MANPLTKRTNINKRLSSRARRRGFAWKKESALLVCVFAVGLWARHISSWRPAADHEMKVAPSASSQKEQTDINHQVSQLPPIVKERCNLQGEDAWMPPPLDWRRRVPSFLVLGAKKCGTTGLFQTLEMHPQIVRGRTKELQFFVPKRFQSSFVENNHTVLVQNARDALFSRQFPAPFLQNNTQFITGEATPDYLMFPDLAGMAILCTIPWAKFIVVLRDPIERLYSHYNYLQPKQAHGKTAGHRKKMAPLEDWIRNDIRILQTVGVLPQNLSQLPSFMGSQEERDGWLKYQRMLKPGAGNPGSDRHFVRSLYAPQLEQWMHLMRQFGKDPQKDLRVIFSKDLKRNSKVINELFQWLGIPPIPNLKVKQSMVTHYSGPPMRDELKEFLLKTIFDHFNARLFRMLGIKPVF